MKFRLWNRKRDALLVTPLPYQDMREDGAKQDAKYPDKLRLAKHRFDAALARKRAWEDSKLPSNVSILRRQAD